MARVKTIGVLTSGGDAPGMNAAIRAVTRAGICNGFNIKGIYRGYDGLINGEIEDFTTENVSGIIMSGGTILKTARSKEFMTDEGKEKAYQQMQEHGIDALVVIGGNGSLTGAMEFAKKFDVCCIGLPGTIDNDLYGTDSTIGYDTTMNTIVECVDRIRDTAQSHERIFFIEVMGRDAGFLAQNSAIASGAEAAIIPEDSTDVDQLARFMERGIRKSKKSCIVIVSESPKCGAMYYAERVRNEFPQYDVRVSILGHLQRGGRPSAHDRILASRTGVGAIEAIVQGQRNVMIGVRNNSGEVKSGEVWVNELRLLEHNNKGGWAANGNLNVQLSDFGSVNATGRYTSEGFGGLEDKVASRSTDSYGTYSVTTSLELGKFFPDKAKVSIPLYLSLIHI